MNRWDMASDTYQQLQREYIESRILSAHPVEIVAMLFQVAMDSLRESITHLKSGDRFARARSVTRAEQAIHELLAALDHSVNAQFSQTSSDLYRYVLNRIVAGHAEESQEAFEEAMSVLQPLAAAWGDLKARILQEPEAKQPEPEAAPEPAPQANDPYAAYRQDLRPKSSRDWSS